MSQVNLMKCFIQNKTNEQAPPAGIVDKHHIFSSHSGAICGVESWWWLAKYNLVLIFFPASKSWKAVSCIMYSVQAIQQLPHTLPIYYLPIYLQPRRPWPTDDAPAQTQLLLGIWIFVHVRPADTTCDHRTSEWNAIPHYLVVVVQVVEPWSFIQEKFRKKFPVPKSKGICCERFLD